MKDKILSLSLQTEQFVHSAKGVDRKKVRLKQKMNYMTLTVSYLSIFAHLTLNS